MTKKTLAERIDATENRIREACDRAGRARDEVTLVAVGKTFPAHDVRAVYDQGITDLGENRAQELREKAMVIPDAHWHFIGPLQTNKVRQVVGVATLIHSVDRIGLADAIGRRARTTGTVQDLLVEVNIAGEATKSGVEPAALDALASQILAIEGVRLRGLMTIPPMSSEPRDSRPFFRDLRHLSDRLRDISPEATELSMGMSRDLEVAVEEGATLVRVGEGIFGPRRR